VKDMGAVDAVKNLVFPEDSLDMQDSMMMTQHTMYTLNIAVMRWKYRLYIILGTLSGATAAAFLEVLIEKYTDYSGIIDILIG